MHELNVLDEAYPMQQVHGHSITYRIALGPQQGKKAMSFDRTVIFRCVLMTLACLSISITSASEMR